MRHLKEHIHRLASYCIDSTQLDLYMDEVSRLGMTELQMELESIQKFTSESPP